MPFFPILDQHKSANESQAFGSESACGRAFVAKNPE
jgi:hypothetical protein